MNTLKGWITTIFLVGTIMVSTANANGGLIIAGATAPAPCTSSMQGQKLDYGVIIAGATGIIFAGLTGIIIAGAKSEPVDCGIIIAG